MDEYFDQKDIAGEIEAWRAKNPSENIENVKRALLPNMWNQQNSNGMEKMLENWLFLKVKENYNLTEDTSKPKSPTAGMTAEEKLNYYRNLSK